MRLLIAIPVFNERKYVEAVLDKVKRFHPDILVIDDGSTDGTVEYLKTRDDIQLICHPENRGYGQSLIDAFKHADARGYEWVITMDCDEQHEPEMIPEFIRQIERDEPVALRQSRLELMREYFLARRVAVDQQHHRARTAGVSDADACVARRHHDVRHLEISARVS